jgi:hypothetical protein
MNRKKELLDLVSDNAALVPLVEEMVYLEDQLDQLRELPKIVIHPKDPTKQRTTPAAKLYKELLQQYTNIVRILIRATGADEIEEDSPLRKWMNDRMERG